MRSKNTLNLRRTAACLAMAMLSTVACAPPPSKAEGVIDDVDFTVEDDAPEMREHRASDGLMVILAEADNEDQRLRTVSIRLPKSALLEPGVVNVGDRDDEAWIELSDGELSTERGDNGITIVNSALPTIWHAVGGTVALLEVRATLAGEFVADFGDIGFVSGKFEVPWETEREREELTRETAPDTDGKDAPRP